ncbi:hypothetical protein JRO89_XS01G0394800 [Xanthoceras sorbifolium]|uniref:Uncharacterized protein n=1 Tax=Xanthoceras sorbifolium TaxID=99658 RepID=A0ABQ8IPY9_9ROSI|nr:hypothetical protein JRO89_XS01G0394800 [Xanthoceras sorbifolium]
MGCGASTMVPEREAVTSKFPPRLRHRFEEIKRRRNAAAVKGTLSKKQLLKEGDASQDSADDKSLSSREESVRAATIAPEPEAIKEEDDNNAVEEETDHHRENKEESEEEEERVMMTLTQMKSPQRVDSGQIVSSVNSNEGLEMKAGEKGKKGKRLTKRKSSNPVKNLLNIKSCYCVSCSAHDNACLLTQKTDA